MEAKKHLTGLTDPEVLENRQKYGTNLLTPPPRKSLWILFSEKLKDPIIRILIIAAFLSLGIAVFEHISSGEGHYMETIGIFFAIILSTGVAFAFEVDAGKKFDILNQVNEDTLVKVIRNGKVMEIIRRDVVVGDIVLLETGEEVPADGELIEAVSMQINESALTGELVISKTIDPEHYEKEATYPSNWVMRGTKVIDGHGIFIVKRVGDATEYGQVAEKSTEITGEETPLNKQLAVLAKFIGVIGLMLSVLTFAVLFLKDIYRGNMHYTLSQLLLLGAVILGGAVALTKVWYPLLYGGFEIVGKEKLIPRNVDKDSWWKWLLYGCLIFIVVTGGIYLFGIDPFSASSWVSMDVAAQVLQYFMVSVTLIIVAVPEGLPMSVTLSLALSMRRMLKTNNLVRKIHACETMGAATVICTDKTGTLTQNQMRVADVLFYSLPDKKLEDSMAGILVQEGISVNSTAFLDFSDPVKVKALGNPTESALLLWLNDNNINYLPIREDTEIIGQLTFSTERKYMATLVRSALTKRNILYVKGAPEIVSHKCSEILTQDGEQPFAPKEKEINDTLLEYQSRAMRTLGFAYKIIDRLPEEIDIEKLAEKGLVFLGIAAISDPVREDVPAAVKRCLNAGIDVKIVTGDTPATAREIGRQIGIWRENDTDENIIMGPDFEALPDEVAVNRVQELKIMCRARPTDKQRLVQLLQRNNEIVAVTGDGTNDAPALNYADVGLSMGSGTSVAKEASDITLLDDSFNSIATAVMWGRSLYKNIQRFILFQLTINFVALILVFSGSVFGYELPLTVTQMLWINLIMDTFAAAALASLPPDENVMNEKPRKNTDFIISASMKKRILGIGIVFVFVLLGILYLFSDADFLKTFFSHVSGDKKAYSLSYFFTFFVMLQFWNMFNAKAYMTGKSAFARMKESSGFIIALIVIIIGQFLIVEFGGKAFRTVPLMLKDWIVITLATSFVLWFGELFRLIKRKS